MNQLQRLRNLLKPPPVYLGAVVAISEFNITVNLLDGSGTMLCNPNPAYEIGNTVQIQGNNIIGATQKVTTVLTFKV